jgi:parallel beta-helix repeat protein
MRYLFGFIFFLFVGFCFGQQEFHVFPIDGEITKGTSEGDGSIQNPWDLQTALLQSSDQVNGGDIIWIHKGIYTGHFRGTLQSTDNDKFITVSGYKDDKVILNGNLNTKGNYVLEVNGGNVIYKNFEITFLGDFSRSKSDKNFKASVGINHLKGEDCKFQNLTIHNIPGSGIGSWKATGGTIIEDCVIYNNGYIGARGHGVGIYIQNQSDKTRLINNNIIFNNYYKGIEVWSATSGSKFEFVKNVTLTDNTIFNNGSPFGKHVDNIIIASNDKEGINVAKHIKVEDNILYHNIDFNNTKNFGYGASLTLGFTSKSPVEDISIKNNKIFGKNNAFNISHAKSIEFQNNIVYAGYIHLNTSVLSALEAKTITSNNNKYYTRKVAGFRFNKHKDYSLKSWQDTFKIDKDSQLKQLKDFEISLISKVQKLETNSNHFNITILEKNGNDVVVDFSEFDVEEGMAFKIYDIENRTVVVKSGKLLNDLKIKFPMALQEFELPLHNSKATKSATNFGVFRIEFENKKKRKSFFGRFFDWLF